MPSNADPALGLLSLVQWLSPAFPTGAFAYSHGLEFAISAGQVPSVNALSLWLQDVLTCGAGAQDAILLAHALQQGADLVYLAALACALAPTSERYQETMEQGAAFARGTAALTGQDFPAVPLPVAVGQAARTLRLPSIQVIALYLHAFAANLVSVAVRFMPLGQTEGQRVLAGLHPVVQSVAVQAAVAPLDSIASSTLRADLAAISHETMQTRIFRT